ncbi:hypothetical protein N0V88_003867 [Collariella sp. IMI 366227]|nr:hypothetical protein N0V88_003867 [Collariella sp. IMI 366227]
MSSDPDKSIPDKGNWKMADDYLEDEIATGDFAKIIQSRSETPRCITPKGPLFPNLGEAHQAITSRLASRSAGHHVLDASLDSSSSVDGPSQLRVAESLPCAREMEFAKPALPVRGRSVTPFFGAQSMGAESTTTPTEQSSAINPLPSSSGDIDSIEVNLSNESADVSTISEPPETGATEEIYGHYIPSSVLGSSSLNRDSLAEAVSGVSMGERYSHRSNASLGSVNVRIPEIRQVDGGIKPGKSRLYVCGSSSNSLEPDLSPPRRDTQSFVTRFATAQTELDFPAQSLDLVADSHELQREPTKGSRVNDLGTPVVSNNSEPPFPQSPSLEQDSVDLGKPFHSAAKEDHGNQAESVDTNQIDTGGDSDEDPFQLDNFECRSYPSLFLQPAREREVSRALRCVSSDSATSAGQIFLPSRVEQNATPRTASSNNPFLNRGYGCQAPTVTFNNWDYEDNSSYPNEVRVTVQELPPISPNAPVEPQTAARLSVIAERFGGKPRKKNRQTLMSDAGEWETVASSVGQFDDRFNEQFDSNQALPSSGSFGWPIKTTGSSIADYSDTTSVYAASFNDHVSPERFIQRPAASYNPQPSLRRTLRDTNRPVFLPQPRIHRVNGYLQQSSATRMFSNQSAETSGAYGRSAIVERLGASMRNRNINKTAQRQDQLQTINRFSKNRFESLSSISSTDSEAERVAECSTTARKNPLDLGVALLPSPLPHEPLGATSSKAAKPSRDRKSTSLDSPNLFSFPLISLEEAAKRQALKRSMEEEDGTVTSGVRTRKNSSMDASKATHRTTPPTPFVAKPAPAHSRRPTTFSMFCNPGAQDNIIGHDRFSAATGRQSADPLIDGRHSVQSRPVQNPIDRNRVPGGYPFINGHYVFPDPPRLIPRDRRHFYRQQQHAQYGGNGTNPSLRRIAALGHGASPFGMPSEDAYVSWEARRRRQNYFYFLCILCIVPFFAVLVCHGTFNDALSWYTHGETGELTTTQRRNVKIVACVFGVIWLLLLVGFIAVLVVKKQMGAW